ncbi:family 1 glycosylhydrolase [Alteribacter natronophilus]|uniref:family 1 glycosylhydrolase n=1 Tax=Alteribacter natronophilus TaxID=2583810 RepID=UPI00110F4EBC|nr:family 1 glycosylhydrolase [Alteribacter natronophilus]TMW71386.1 glycosyl hydrolase family protein [Alteribacter natronophilus]
MNKELEPLVWAVGIENTFVTQTEKGERPLDEYQLTQHYTYWKEDLEKARAAGATMIRYGIPWHRVEKTEGVYDWSWVDEVMDYFSSNRSLVPIIDLMHYGTPDWLHGEFLNGRYPQAVSRYAASFARRYGHFIKYYTPLNEPYVNAEFCGWNGVWPPYQKGLSGFYRLIVQLGKGIIQTVESVSKEVPDAVFVHVDATKKYYTRDEKLEDEAQLWNENSMVMWELIQGKINSEHPLYSFLLDYGITPSELEVFLENPTEPDVIGVNYYPQFSVHEVKRDNMGNIITPHILGDEEDMSDIIREFYWRYKKPVMITETSFRGSEYDRNQWLEASKKACMQLRSEGLPVTGVTWFPFMDLVDWEYRTSGKSVEDELLPFGLITLVMKDGVLVREKNSVYRKFQELAKNSD